MIVDLVTLCKRRRQQRIIIPTSTIEDPESGSTIHETAIGITPPTFLNNSHSVLCDASDVFLCPCLSYINHIDRQTTSRQYLSSHRKKHDRRRQATQQRQARRKGPDRAESRSKDRQAHRGNRGIFVDEFIESSPWYQGEAAGWSGGESSEDSGRMTSSRERVNYAIVRVPITTHAHLSVHDCGKLVDASKVWTNSVATVRLALYANTIACRLRCIFSNTHIQSPVAETIPVRKARDQQADFSPSSCNTCSSHGGERHGVRDG